MVGKLNGSEVVCCERARRPALLCMGGVSGLLWAVIAKVPLVP